MTVAHQLARLRVVGREAEPVDHVVEAPLEELQQVLARDALHADRLVVVAAELALGEAVDALHLLLLAQLRTVVRQLAAARLAVLAGGVGAALVAALVRVAAVPLEEQLHVFAPAEPTNRSRVVSHLSDSPPLRGPATVVGDGGEIADEGDLETGRSERAQRRLAARAGALHVDAERAHAVLHRLVRGVFGGELRRERRRLARALEALHARRRPGNDVARDVRDRDDRVVERRGDVSDAALDVLLRLLGFGLALRGFGRATG